MSTSQNSRDEVTPPTSSPVVFMLGTIGDTTWRMFVPTIGLTTAGYFGDKAIGSKPWLFIIGITIGSCITGLLIRNQLRKQS